MAAHRRDRLAFAAVGKPVEYFAMLVRATVDRLAEAAPLGGR
jgi:hypothetical protein